MCTNYSAHAREHTVATHRRRCRLSRQPPDCALGCVVACYGVRTHLDGCSKPLLMQQPPSCDRAVKPADAQIVDCHWIQVLKQLSLARAAVAWPPSCATLAAAKVVPPIIIMGTYDAVGLPAMVGCMCGHAGAAAFQSYRARLSAQAGARPAQIDMGQKGAICRACRTFSSAILLQ